MTHTPGPWFAGDDYVIYAPDHEEPGAPWVVATANVGCGYPEISDAANAAFIVRACNSYHELLEALEAAQAYILHVGANDTEAGRPHPQALLCTKIADALSRARGSSNAGGGE